MEAGLLKRILYEATLGLISLADNIRPIRFASLPLNHFGYSCSWGANLAAELEQIPWHKRPIFVFEEPNQVANLTLYKLWSRRFRLSNLACQLTAYARQENRYRHLLHAWRDEPYFDKSGLAAEAPPPIAFNKSEKLEAHAKLKEFGLDPEKPWVCLCVRELGYLTHKLGPDQSQENSYRQCSIQNYAAAAEYLINSGMQVVRMGVRTEQRLDDLEKRSGYFDYSQSERSDFLDIFLVSECRFYLGDSDGLVNVARLFKRPTVIANWIPISLSNTARHNAIILFKPIVEKRTQRVLSFYELVAEECGELLTTTEYDKQNLDPQENSSDEILSATKLMVELLMGKPLPQLEAADQIRKQLRLREPLHAYLPQFEDSAHSKLTRPDTGFVEEIKTLCENSELGKASWLAKQQLAGQDQLAWLQRIRGLACHWSAKHEAPPKQRTSVPLCYTYLPDDVEMGVPKRLKQTKPALKRKSDERIKLGYLSFDFRSHSAGFPLLPLIKNHSAQDFEVLALNLGEEKLPRNDQVREIHLHGLSPSEQLHQVSEQNIDLIINTTDNLPESCQSLLKSIENTPILSAWGYYPEFDNRINSAVLTDSALRESLPMGSTLEVVEVPSYHMQKVEARNTTTKQSHDDGRPRLGAFNNLYKLEESLFNAWLDILISVPNSTLSLPASNAYAQRRLARRASQRGLSAKRITFEPRLDRVQHLIRLSGYSLLLDNPAMGSGGQIFDSLEVGVPCITLDRKQFFHRSGTSISSTLGLTQFLAGYISQYKDMAISLLSNPNQLLHARTQVLAARSRYMESTFPNHFSEYEKALRKYLVEQCHRTA